MAKEECHPSFKCWNCDKPTLIPHPDRESKKHPYQDWSFVCTICVDTYNQRPESNLVCCKCHVGTPDWWYPEGEELWEDVYICKYCEDTAVFCQSCYFGHCREETHKTARTEKRAKRSSDLLAEFLIFHVMKEKLQEKRKREIDTGGEKEKVEANEDKEDEREKKRQKTSHTVSEKKDE